MTVQSFSTAAALLPQQAELEAIRALVTAGARMEALARLDSLQRGLRDPRLWQQAGEVRTACLDFHGAVSCYRRAVRLAPDEPHALYNLAAALIATGDLEEAEQLFARVLRLDPGDYDAWWNRSSLRRWTAAENHVEGLRAALQSTAHGPGRTALGYALAKELEDLGRHAESFEALREAAATRRRGLAYRVEMDIEAMALIQETFTARRLAGVSVSAEPGPIFLMGLPRSGTTLVDRILSSHSRVESLGEISDFALCLTRLISGPDKGALIRAAAEMDFARLGQAYGEAIRSYGRTTLFLIDKTPANYLYVGLIALALPGARIVHVERDPMDNGYALFKTLFRTGCPYSYDLTDLGRYVAAQRRLMAHWRSVLPNRMVEVRYEDLVRRPADEARRLLAGVGLDWEPACLAFHENRAPTATASAAQVRRPIYRTSVELWRRYEDELAPLARTLAAEGCAP